MKNGLTSSLIALSALLLVGGPVSAALTSHTLDDGDVRRALEGRLLYDELVSTDRIDVDVDQGIVTLSGTVHTPAERRRAVALARILKGVRSVVDRLEVKPAPRSDDHMRRDVERALLLDPATESYELHAAAHNATVTLTGTVESWAQAQLALEVAENVKGVKNVESRVTVKYPRRWSDTEMAAEITGRLAWDARVDAGLIHVGVKNGRVTLVGSVGSALERAYAAGDARVAGVKAVDPGGLEVEWWARNPMQRDELELRSDEQIADAVKDALRRDPRTVAFQPEVAVREGVVTLSGVVDSLVARRSAARDAIQTVGVTLVRNHLRVRPAQEASDSQIEAAVMRAMRRDPYLDALTVDVSVLRGRTYLSGTVDTGFDRRRAEAVASAVPGVTKVLNALNVMTPVLPRDDRRIREDIQERLFWSPFVNEKQVSVALRDGVATLTGTVDSWNEKMWAEAAARRGGATSVRDDLKVEPEGGMRWLPFSF